MYIMFFFYQLLTLFSIPFLFFYFLFRKFKGKTVFGNIKERLGFVPLLKVEQERPMIWIHAVSVGEVLSIQYFIEKLRHKNPGAKICVTTGTATGKKMAEKNLNTDVVSFLPFDFLLPQLLLFRRWKPSVLFIMEAETWPNMLMLAKMHSLPIYCINARLRDYVLHGNLLRRIYLRWAYKFFNHLYVQSEEDKNRFKLLGVEQEKLSVLGDVKSFNVAEKKRERSNVMLEYLEKELYITTLLVGSVHPGELDVYLTLFANLKKTGHAVRMILAPRHFHWKEELVKKVKSAGFSFSMWDERGSEEFNSDILLVCRLGILFDLYQYANIFYLGGTFVTVGGHNLLEPAAFSLPMFIGPHHGNCKVTADALEQCGALKKIANVDELCRVTTPLLGNAIERVRMGRRAGEWLDEEAKKVELVLDSIHVLRS